MKTNTNTTRNTRNITTRSVLPCANERQSAELHAPCLFRNAVKGRLAPAMGRRDRDRDNRDRDRDIKRGDIYYANLDHVIGSEQGGNRPVLVVQNDVGNRYSPTIIIVPLTYRLGKNPLPTHVMISNNSSLGSNSLALMEQIRTIDRSRISDYIGRIDSPTQSRIDEALSVSLGFEEKRSVRGELIDLCLCRRCEGDFRNSGYIVVKKGFQEVKGLCDYCKIRMGFDFGVFNGSANPNV